MNQNEDTYDSEQTHHIKDIRLPISQMEKLLEDKKEMQLHLQNQFDLVQQTIEDRHQAEMKVSKDALGALRMQHKHEQEIGQNKQSAKQIVESKDNKVQEAMYAQGKRLINVQRLLRCALQRSRTDSRSFRPNNIMK